MNFERYFLESLYLMNILQRSFNNTYKKTAYIYISFCIYMLDSSIFIQMCLKMILGLKITYKFSYFVLFQER